MRDMASNWLLINLTRHSTPLQTGNVVSRTTNLFWRRARHRSCPYGATSYDHGAMMPGSGGVMNPRVKCMASDYYPEITEWADYKGARPPIRATPLGLKQKRPRQ